MFHGFTFVVGQDPIPSGPENKYPQAIFMLAVLQFACLVGYGFVGSLLYSRLFPSTNLRLVAAPLLLLLLVPIVWFGLGHIYDFSVLLLSSCMLLAMAYRKHALYLLIFTVSCLNKETTILIGFAYAMVFYRRLPFSFYALMLAAQVVIFSAIYISVKFAFAQNAGGPISFWLFNQPGWLSHQQLIFYLVASAIVFVVSFRWNEKPEFLRRSMIMVLPHLALLLYGAMPGERRNWYESVPILSMLVLRNVEFMGTQWWVPLPTMSTEMPKPTADTLPVPAYQ